MIQNLEQQCKQAYIVENQCPNCNQQQKLVHMYEKLVRLLKAKLNKQSIDQSKEGFFQNNKCRALSENRSYLNKTNTFFEESKNVNEKLGESQLTSFLKSISTNVSENSKVISKSNAYMKQMKELSIRVHKKDVRIANLTSDLLTLKSNLLSLRNILFQFFRMTPLPKLTGASQETMEIICNIFQYSECEKDVMFKKRDITHLVKPKEEYKIDGNKNIYLPNFETATLQVP